MALLAASERMREYEKRAAALNSKEEALAQARGDWLQKTTLKGQNQQVKQKFEELKARREQDLDARRARLASKLAAEDERLKQELLGSQETPEQRRSRMAERARELQARREAERQETAKALYAKSFQESCDVLRDTNSKRVLYRTLEERNAQIEQKMASRIAEEEEKRMYYEMNEAERLRAEQRHVDDKSRIHERRDATVRILEEQVRNVNLRRDDEAGARRQEIQELRELWDKMAKEQEAEEASERERMKKLSSELQQYNLLRQAHMSDKERTERELDLKILQEALSREAADESAERAAKATRAADVKHYRQQLALMMQNEAEDDAEREAMIQAVFAEQQARRDAEQEAREEARRRLMAEVDAVRQQQIYYKQQKRLLEAGDKEVQRRLNSEAEAAQAQADARSLTELRKKQLLQRLEVQTQMVARAHIAAAEEDEKLRALEVAQHAESGYMDKVKESLRTTDPPVWHGRKKNEWYS